MISFIQRALLIGCISILLFSCHQSQESIQSNKPANYQLVKVDSIRIESLETIQITDYHEGKEQFLAYAVNSKKCMLVDKKGKIISQVDLTGEGPGHFGMGMTELGFFGDDIAINGPNMYLIFDGQWNYKERIVYESGGAYYPVGMIRGAPEVVIQNGQAKILKPIDQNNFGNTLLKEDHFANASMMELIASEQKGSEQILKYPENSIYRKNASYYSSHQPVFSFNRSKGELILALPLERRIYTYDVNSNFSLKTSTDLNLTGFGEPEGIPYADQHKNPMRGFGAANELNYVLGKSNSRVIGLDSHGNTTLVKHQTGFERAPSLTSNLEAGKLSKRENKYITSFWIDNKNVLETDQELNRMVLMTEQQFIIYDRNEDEELDYTQYYIYELQRVESVSK